MGNNRTSPKSRIKNICNSVSVNEMDIYEKARMLLEIYSHSNTQTKQSAVEAIYNSTIIKNKYNTDS